MKHSFLFVCALTLALLLPQDCRADLVTLGDPDFSVGTLIDSWDSNMVVQESYNYTNTTSQNQRILLSSWSFNPGANRGQVTPFLVTLNDQNSNGDLYDDNHFTVRWIGSTAVSDSTAGGAGLGDWGAGSVNSEVSLTQAGSFQITPGESIAIAFLNSNADGSGTTDPGSVITWDRSLASGEMWYNGTVHRIFTPTGRQ